jgi:hypothetical protein
VRTKAGLAKLANAMASKAIVRKDLWVRVPHPAQALSCIVGGHATLNLCIAERFEKERLRIFCDDRYPGLQAEAKVAIQGVHPARKVYLVPSVGCSAVMGLLETLAVLVAAAWAGNETHSTHCAGTLAT